MTCQTCGSKDTFQRSLCRPCFVQAALKQLSEHYRDALQALKDR